MTIAHLVDHSLAAGVSTRSLTLRRAIPACGVALIAAAIAGSAFLYVERTLHRSIEPRLATRLGVPVRIGAIAANLSGSVELSEVEVGSMFTAETIELGASWRSMLAGQFRPGEVVLRRFAVHARVDDAGLASLAELYRRALGKAGDAGRAAQGEASDATALRIVATDGTVNLAYGALASVQLTHVDIVPTGEQLRVTSQGVELKLAHAGYLARFHFDRSAADVDLASHRVVRALAVAGSGAVEHGAIREAFVGLSASFGTDRQHDVVAAGAFAGAPEQPFSIAWHRDDTLTLQLNEAPLAILAPALPPTLDVSEATATGHLVLQHMMSPAPGQAIVMTAHGQLNGAAITQGLVATEPVPLSLKGEATASFAQDVTTITHYAVSLGDVALAGNGYLDTSDGIVALRLAANIAPVACLDALESIPPVLRGALTGLTPRGMLQGGLEIRYDATKPVGHGAMILTTLDVEDCEILADAQGADPLALLAIAPRRFVDGTTRLVGPGAPGYVGLATLPAHVDAAFVAGEDASFYLHDGFAPDQIARSLDFNFREQGVLRGASTISQQLIKNEFLDRQRTLARKLQEAILTWRLESLLTKRQILERYLNVIELGPGVWGVGQAASFWFGVDAAKLTAAQAALFAAMTPGPMSAARRIAGAGRLDDVTWERTKLILGAMRRAGALSDDAHAAATASRLAIPPAVVVSLRARLATAP
ncbi:MAG: transglycosylase domain-containing protein [Myxococcales bacterium]|nr:transglycosylase domain-containing protein [Myxococcales bacterium]